MSSAVDTTRMSIPAATSSGMREWSISCPIKAAKVTGLEIAGVDIIYDREQEEYVVLEVNGIPAFATPEQEAMGLNFNDLKIEKVVSLIEKKAKAHHHNQSKQTVIELLSA